MAGIWNINSAYHINSKRVVSKLSFDLGQVFQARIVDFDEAKLEVLLKMLDGWQFAAKLSKPLAFLPDGLIRFQVQGFEDGKLQLHILPKMNQEETKHDSIENMLEEQHILLGEEDHVLLEKMIQHHLPLTKENIINIKTMADLRQKIVDNDNEEGKFIKQYMESKGLDPQEPKGRNAENKLQGFFKELKTSSIDDLLTLYENGIEITEENLKSLHKISNGTGVIYKEIQELAETEMPDNLHNVQETRSDMQMLDAGSDNATVEKRSSQTVIHHGDDQDIIAEIRKQADLLQTVDKSTIEEEQRPTENVSKSNDDVEIKGEEKHQQIQINTGSRTIVRSEEKITQQTKNAIEKSSGKLQVDSKISPENKLSKVTEDTVNEIKMQIRAKIEETKVNIKTVLDSIAGDKTEVLRSIYEGLGEKINDFKVYNTLSSQYYYLDVPLEIRNKTYGCKLIIKDERKKGKKIDSKNVSFVASVKTMNIGTIDAYIKVRNSNMTVELCSDEKWQGILNSGVESISKKLEQLGYNVLVKMKPKENEVSITNCSEFFHDNGLASINVKV